MRPHRWQPTRLPCPWDSPGKNTGVGSHFLLQCMKVKSESEVAQSCPTLRDPMDCSLPGSSVHGSLQARVLEWGAQRLLMAMKCLLLETHGIYKSNSETLATCPMAPSVEKRGHLWLTVSFVIVVFSSSFQFYFYNLLLFIDTLIHIWFSWYLLILQP